MAGRQRRIFYAWIFNEFNEYYSAEIVNGNYVVSKSVNPQPLRYNPSNLKEALKVEMATNRTYFSANRFVSSPFNFIKDGAAICKYLDYTKEGYNTRAFLTITR